jgi:hypothetical protein
MKGKEMKEKCPHCGKGDCIPEVAYTNTEMYGGSFHTVRCLHCNKLIDVCMSRIVKLQSMKKSEKKQADW